MAERGVPVVFRPENPPRQSARSGPAVRVHVPEKRLFHVARNNAIAGTHGVRAVVQLLRQRLPTSWRVSEGAHHDREATVVIRAPDSKIAQPVLVSLRRIEPRDVAGILSAASPRRSRASALLVTAPFLSPRTRELLAAACASYVDATGNLRLALERPVVYLETQGAEKDPVREPRPLVSLKGPAAGRVVRALCDFRPPYGVRELAERCATAPASVSRVVSLLERDAIVVRGDAGDIADLDWLALLRRWTQDYQFTASNSVMTFLEPRGLDTFLEKLRHFGRRHALSGSLAAARKAPTVSPRQGIAYVDDPTAAADLLDLRAGDRGANLLLATPFDPVVFDRSWSERGVTYAALSQVVADLLTCPGRGSAEGTELIAWMRKNDRVWRT